MYRRSLICPKDGNEDKSFATLPTALTVKVFEFKGVLLFRFIKFQIITVVFFYSASLNSIPGFSFFSSKEPSAVDVPKIVDRELLRCSLEERERSGFEEGVLLAESDVSKELLANRRLTLDLARERNSLSALNADLKKRLGTQLAELKEHNSKMFDQVRMLQAELALAKSGAASVAQTLLERIKNHQYESFSQLKSFKVCLANSEEKLKSQADFYKKKLEAMFSEVLEQKNLQAHLQENFIKVRQSLEALRQTNPTLSFELNLRTRENQELAQKLARREKLIANLTSHKKALEGQMANYTSERNLLQGSLDQMYKSNEKLLAKNQGLESFLKDKQKEIELKVAKLAYLEREQAEFQAKIDSLRKKLEQKDPSRLVRVAGEFSQKLAKANADQLQLKDQITKLMGVVEQTKEAHQNILAQTLIDREHIKNLEDKLADSNRAISSVKAQQMLVLKKFGIETEDPELSVAYRRQVSKGQMRELYSQVVYKGKAFLDDDLKKALESNDLTKSLVDDLERRVVACKGTAASDSAFSKIFSSLESNNLKSSFSKLYTHFLAKTCAGFSDEHNFQRFKSLAQEHFKNNLITMVQAKDLADPGNYLLMSLA